MEKSYRRLIGIAVLALGVVSCNQRQEQPIVSATPQGPPVPAIQPDINNAPPISADRTAVRRRLAEEFVQERERRLNLYKSGWESLVKIKALGAILQLPEGQGNERTQNLVNEIIQKNADEWVPETRDHAKTFAELTGRIKSEYPADIVLNELMKKIPSEVKLKSLPDPKENNAEAINKWATLQMNEFYTWVDPLEADLNDVAKQLITNISPQGGSER